MISTLFFTSANERYEPFVLPYITSVLEHNEDTIVEIVLKDPKQFESENRDALEVLGSAHPERFRLRPGKFDCRAPHSVRFLETPIQMAEYVYIGDIDILILEEVIAYHIAHMQKTKLPYSNILRQGKMVLSGLHFTQYQAYYPLPSCDPKLFGLDEKLLFEIVKAKGHSFLPDDDWIRKCHGFHLTLQRPSSQWDLPREHLPAYSALRRSRLWQQLDPLFDTRYRRLICLLDTALREKFPMEMELMKDSIVLPSVMW